MQPEAVEVTWIEWSRLSMNCPVSLVQKLHWTRREFVKCLFIGLVEVIYPLHKVAIAVRECKHLKWQSVPLLTA